MPKLVNGSAAITIAKKTGTVLTLLTDEKYCDSDQVFTIGVREGTGVANTASADVDVSSTQGSAGGTNISGIVGNKATSEPSSGYYLRMQAEGSGSSKITGSGWMDEGNLAPATASETKYFPIQVAQVGLSGTNVVTPSASLSGSNVTLSNTNNGISVNATGGGTASAVAEADVTQDGYIPENAGITPATINAQSATTTASSYLAGVTLQAPASGTRSFSITLPNGSSDTITLMFTVDSNGNWTVE